MTGILGRKKMMTNLFFDGVAVPVTVIEVTPNKVISVQTEEKNGYSSYSLAFGKKSAKKVSKAMKTVFANAGADVSAMVREFRMSGEYKVGDSIDLSSFQDVKYVDITGTSKGKGFQGVMKRWNFAGGPKSHGSTLFHRRTGSIGSFASSGRVWKGKKMPGQMGNKRVTTQNLEVMRVDVENNLLLVKGGIPGPMNGYVMVRDAVKKRGNL